MTFPFIYPLEPHVRRHGPQGYANYAGYRPWLRDEFSFRCVYCLIREQWSQHGLFGIDHFLAVTHRPKSVDHYENLLYACSTCNAAKGECVLPDPCRVLLSGAIWVLEDGTIHAETAEAARLIEVLGLDSPRSTEFRLLWIGIVALAARHDLALYHKVTRFPDDLPDLSRLRPPNGNTREIGLAGSWFAQRAQGTLPANY